MLTEYESDCHTGMDIALLSGLLYDYTSGYPCLVSRPCKFMDERIPGSGEFPTPSSAWTKAGFLRLCSTIIISRRSSQQAECMTRACRSETSFSWEDI